MKNSITLLATLLLIISTACNTYAAPRSLPYINAYPVTYAFAEKHLNGLKPDDLRKVRNAIYARHGRSFSDAALQRFFNAQSWYHKDTKYGDNRLTAMDKRNAAFITKYEKFKFGGNAAKHPEASSQPVSKYGIKEKVTFLKSIHQYATLAQIKKLLPSGTKYSAPVWEQYRGNRIAIKGKISGHLFFVPRHPPERWGMEAIDNPHNSDPKYKPTDVINVAEVYINNKPSTTDGVELSSIKQAQNFLGRPEHFSYQRYEDDMDPGTKVGWQASWSLDNGRGIYNDYSWYCGSTVGRGCPVFKLHFNEPNWRGAG